MTVDLGGSLLDELKERRALITINSRRVFSANAGEFRGRSSRYRELYRSYVPCLADGRTLNYLLIFSDVISY